MGSSFQFAEEMRFWPAIAAELLQAVPDAPGVVALRGERAGDQPYITRAADMRRRLARLLGPPEVGADGQPVQSKRLNLRERVHSIAWTRTGSEFESLLVLYGALAASFGVDGARKRMRLHAPYCLRLNLQHEHPRLYSTNRYSRASLGELYGPFPSRAAADRYAEAVDDLYRLRRCHEDLEVHPDHPGCAYGEMRKCMAPCNVGCSADEYRAEADAVRLFLDTHGASMLEAVGRERDAASESMDFEQAAALHERYSKVKAAAALADELVRPLPMLQAMVVQRATDGGDRASMFLLSGGLLAGPAELSTLGVRAVREQTSVGSSLFAQPLMLQAVPLDGEATAAVSPELRAETALQALAAALPAGDDAGRLADHLSLFRRWYYRPERQRAGEVFLPNPDGSWPLRRILNGAARTALGDPKPMQETDREGAAAIKTKLLHPGREGVEREVPVLPRRTRRGSKAITPSSVL